ncbi:hypothetical protein ACFQHO_14270 [Actinomadura yumaensis]
MTTLESTVWVLVAKELGRPPELGELFTAFDQHLPAAGSYGIPTSCSSP